MKPISYVTVDGGKLRDLRKKVMRMSRPAFADMVGCCEHVLYRAENELTSIRRTTFDSICEALEVHPRELVKMEVTMRPMQDAFKDAVSQGRLSLDPQSKKYYMNYMYMFTENGVDQFKHILDRTYLRPPR